MHFHDCLNCGSFLLYLSFIRFIFIMANRILCTLYTEHCLTVGGITCVDTTCGGPGTLTAGACSFQGRHEGRQDAHHSYAGSYLGQLEGTFSWVSGPQEEEHWPFDAMGTAVSSLSIGTGPTAVGNQGLSVACKPAEDCQPQPPCPIPNPRSKQTSGLFYAAKFTITCHAAQRNNTVANMYFEVEW